mgnify:CR=1 FL=1
MPGPSFACVSHCTTLRSGRLLSLCMQAKSTQHNHSTRCAKGAQPELSIHHHFDDCCELQHFASRTE